MEITENGEDSSWAPEEEVDDDTNSSLPTSNNWQPQWNNCNADQAIELVTGITEYDNTATPHRFQYATAAAALTVTPDDLFSVSTASTNQTAKKSNTSHSPSNSIYASPTGIADDTSSAYFARSPFTVAPITPTITPTSTVMSYSSSNMEGSEEQGHNRNESFATEATMGYDASTVETSSAVAILYQGYASSSAADDTCTTGSGADGDPNLSTDTCKNAPNIQSNEDSALGAGVLRLLEEGGDGDASFAPRQKKRTGGENICARIRGKSMLLLAILVLAIVCLVVGLYVAMPRNKGSEPSEARTSLDKENSENISFVGNDTQRPSLKPTTTPLFDVPEMDIPVSSASNQGGEASESKPREGESIPQAPDPLTTVERCGNGQYGNGECSDLSLCCSTYGWCGAGKVYCGE